MDYRNIVITDIDGCLTDYPAVFLSWLSEFKELSFNSLEELKDSISNDEYEVLKHSYRTSGIKRNLPVFSGAKETLNGLKKKGMIIWIVTTRPGWEPVLSDTKFWLDKNEMCYDELFFVNNKQVFIEQMIDRGIKIAIDDEYEVVEFASNLNINALHFNNQNKSINNKIVVVNNWREIQDYLKIHNLF